jgi:hypothetical protein
MPVSKKTFVGGINQDDASFIVGENEYLGALNIRFATTENGEVGKITNIEGTVEKNQTQNSTGNTVAWSLPGGVNRTIGAIEDTKNRRLIWFNWNSANFHGIYCYDADTDLIYTVLKQGNTTTLLNFQEDKFVHSVSMIGDLLYWTDDYNEPKKINVEAGIKMNHPAYVTTVEKYDAFTIQKSTGGSGYVNGTYTNVPLTGGSGTGAIANITVVGTVVDTITIMYHGTGYSTGETLSASNANLGGTGSGLAITIVKTFDPKVVSLIRPQPWAPLTVDKAIDATFQNNFIQSEAFQFAYRFVYRDGEVSTFSPLSKLIDYNNAAENTSGYNAVNVGVQAVQFIEQDVSKIEFAVKYMTGGKLFVFKTINSKVILNNHNTGFPITFKFYNDVVGTAVDDATSVKQFDSVPVKSKALEIAKNRLFLGNNQEGYDTPVISSLNIGSNDVSTSAIVGQWFKMIYRKNGVVYTKYFLRVENITTNPGFYEKNVAFVPPPYPNTADISTDYTFRGASNSALASYLGITISDILSFSYENADATVTGATLAGLANKVVFKTDASYRAGIVFYDYAGRKSGVYTNDNIKAVTPERDYSGTSFVEKISWSLSNSSAVNEIPNWATHYSIVRTKCLRTKLFIQMPADAVQYISKDSTGEYIAPVNGYTATAFGIAVKVTSLFSYGLGYSYQDGDIMKLYTSSGTIYKLRVKDTYSDYIIVELANVGTSPTAMYEVYSPYLQSETEYYYEVGETYKVNNPGTPSRQYSTVNGYFTGDVTISEKTAGVNTRWVENMSPIDRYWSNWYTDAGRLNIVTPLGSVRKEVSISYSNTIVPGTNSNGLSSFEALDQTSVPTELGGISRLVFTSKTVTDGTVMLAIGENETASLYLGESQVFDNTGSSFLAKSSGVIGNVNVLKGSYGTIHPESVFEWQGSVVFFDAYKGCWVSYDLNGLVPVSNNKMFKYFKKVGQDLLDHLVDTTNYDDANSNLSLRVLGGVDPFHNEYLMSMPRMFLNPQNTQLSDMAINTLSASFTTSLPTLGVSPSTLSGFTYAVGSGPSASQSVLITGTNLLPNGSLTVTCSSSFEVSSDNVSFACLATFPYTGTSATPTLYIRMKAGLSNNTYNESVTVTGGGAPTGATVSLSGTVSLPVVPYIILTPSTIGGRDYVEGSGPSAASSFTVVAGNLTPSSGNISIPASSEWEFSTTSSTTGFSSAGTTIAYTGGALASTTVWVRLKAGLSVSTYTNTLSVTGGSATASLTLSGEVSDSEIMIYIYDAGAGNTGGQACFNYVASPVNLFTTSSTINVGTVLYTNGILTSLFLGYSHVFISGALWEVNPGTGTITAYSITQC